MHLTYRMSAQPMLNRTSLIKPPQYRVEGSQPDDLAKSFTDGTYDWITPLQESLIEKDNQPEYKDNNFAGTVDRQGKFQIWENNFITLKGRVINTADSLNLLKWAINSTSSGKQGPAESRTWLYSYNGNDDDEIFVVARGCKPQSCTLSMPHKDIVMIELVMKAKYFYESNTDPATDDNSAQKYRLGKAQSGLKTNETLATPIRFQDLGDFNYDAKAKLTSSLITGVEARIKPNFRQASFQIQWGFRTQDSQGSDRDVYYDYGSRTISGSIDVFKSDEIINEEARTDLLSPAWINIAKATSADVHASMEVGTTNKMKIFSKLPGTIGNSIKVGIKLSGNQTKPTIDVRGKTIQINAKTNETLTNIIAAINAPDDPAAGTYNFARRLVIAGLSAGTASNSAAATAGGNPVALTGGDDNVSKIMLERFKFLPSNENLLEDTEATIESKSFEADEMTAAVAA